MTERETSSTRGTTYAERTIGEGFWQGVADGAGIAPLSEPERKRIKRAARADYLAFRRARGYATNARALTTPDAQPKLGKSERYALGYMLTPERGLSPETLATLRVELARPVNLCPLASLGCAMACLNKSGKGAMQSVQIARASRTVFLLTNPYAAGVLIGSEVSGALAKYGADNVTLRLNVLSDIRWERMPHAETVARALIALGVRLYDYTAYAPEDRADAERIGWHLTYSAKEPEHTPDEYLARVLASGRNVAMPFTTRRGEALPEWHALAGRVFRVIDGDLSDDRTEDPAGVIVGLRAKGSAGRADASGFIREPNHGTADSGALV